MFRALREKIGGGPARMMQDFEKGILKAAQKVFPETVLGGCHFHMLQAVQKQVHYKIIKSNLFYLNLLMVISIISFWRY